MTQSHSPSSQSPFERIVSWLGRVLSRLTYLGTVLLIYIAFSFVTYVWLAIQFGTLRGKAAVIAYDVATGGNPVAYTGDIRPSFPILWIWMAIFHVISWIVVPVVVATIIDVVYRLHEQRRFQAKKRLEKRIRSFGITRFGYSGATLDQFVDRTFETVEDLIRGSS